MRALVSAGEGKEESGKVAEWLSGRVEKADEAPIAAGRGEEIAAAGAEGDAAESEPVVCGMGAWESDMGDGKKRCPSTKGCATRFVRPKVGDARGFCAEGARAGCDAAMTYAIFWESGRMWVFIDAVGPRRATLVAGMWPGLVGSVG